VDRPLRGRAPDRTRPRSWLGQLGIASAEPVDDPRICPPAIRGQLLLFRPRRQLTDAHARRIKDRDLAGYDRLRETAIALAAGRGLTTAWWRGTCLMLRLALAIREADGDDQIPEEALDDLPRFRNAVADVLRHAELTGAGALLPRRGARAVVPRSPQRSCKHCDCWGTRAILPATAPGADAGASPCWAACAGPAACTSTGTARRRGRRHGPSCGSAASSPPASRCGPGCSATSPRTRRPGPGPPPGGRRPRRSRRTWPSRGRPCCSTPAATGAASPSGRWASCHP
jgi:hypothetical protein